MLISTTGLMLFCICLSAYLQGVDPDDKERVMYRASDDDVPFSALAFKIMNDPFVGTLTFTRIYRCARTTPFRFTC